MTDTLARNKRRLTREDILPPADYAAMRSEQRKRMTEIKRRRRVEVGPFATFYFENFDTMRHQVQEMLHIEQGGDAQIADELAAYNPLIPQGKELVATVCSRSTTRRAAPRCWPTWGGSKTTCFSRSAENGSGASPIRRARTPARRQGVIGPVPQISVQ
jgi:Protein of unknown function (DUF3501)